MSTGQAFLNGMLNPEDAEFPGEGAGDARISPPMQMQMAKAANTRPSADGEAPPVPQEIVEKDDGPRHRIIQQTLCIIKPDAIKKADEIINVFRREGLSVLQTRRVQLTPEQAATFYQDAYQQDWFAGAVSNLSSGPLLAMVLCGPEAVRHVLELLGPASWNERVMVPTSMRCQYGQDGSDYENALHGSENEAEALRELHFFFPEVIVEPLLGDNMSSLYLNQNVHPVLTVGLSKLLRERPADPVMWLADWLLANNPNKPKELNTGSGVCT